MVDYTQSEQTFLQDMAKRLIRLREFLNSADVESDKDILQWFSLVAQIKEIQGNSNNDVSFIACLMAKDFLAASFDLGEFDVAAKAQGAPGLDIDLQTLDGKHIIGEIKTTVLYSGAKNDLGAKQKESFKKDFEKLNKTPADYKYFFVTDAATFDIVKRKYTSLIPSEQVVLLPHHKN